MKRIILEPIALILFILVMTGCRKEHQFMNDGVIVGWNYGACVTCGGFYLNLSNDTTINANTYYVVNHADNLNSIIAQYFIQYNKDHLPIYVSVDWQLARMNNPNLPANWIRVTDIRTR